MTTQTDPASEIQSRIARRSKRIARWEKEADEIDVSWTGAIDYRQFCQGMAGDAREKQQELEADLKQLQNRSALALRRQHCLHEQGNL